VTSGNKSRAVVLSIVVPCFEESDGLLRFHGRLIDVLGRMHISFEILYVNDGSADDTIDVLNSLQSRDARVGLIDLSRNFGKEIALTAGIDHARGDAVIVLDADLQDPPEYIPEMVAAWRDGYDVVAMRRADRSSDTAFKRISATLFYRLLGYLSPVEIPQNVGDFRLMSRRAVEALKKLPERNRYMKGLFAWIGFNRIELPYRRDPRYAGNTKMPFLKLAGLALDGITSFSAAPLRLASISGVTIALGAVLFGAFMLVKKLIYGDPAAGYTTLIVMMTFLGGMQLAAIGLLGEYVGRLLIECKRRPLYLVNEVELPLPVPIAVEVGLRKGASG
jgi:polyisoprenyl-phosphate glycosyltransferase